MANFCDAHRVPCVFPSLEAVPEKASSGRFSFYLSGGLAAEAALLANGVSATANLNSSTTSMPPVDKLAGVAHFSLRDDAAGDVASKAFDRSLETNALSLPKRLIAGTLADLGSALASVQTNEATALWLHAADLNRLMQAHAPPPGFGPVWVSASLAPPHRVQPPAAWRSRLVWALAAVRQRSPQRRRRFERATLGRFTGLTRGHGLGNLERRARSDLLFHRTPWRACAKA